MRTRLQIGLIRLAYNNPVLRPHILPMLKVAEGSFAEFMREVGDKKVTNPDTGNEVKIKSLKGPKGKELVHKEYERWVGTKPKSTEKKPKKSGIPTLDLKPDRYERCTFYLDVDWSTKVKKAFGKNKPFSKESVADMLGLSTLTQNKEYTVTVEPTDSWTPNIIIAGPDIEFMKRTLHVDEKGNPYIHNHTMQLSPDAPKGLGTRIFATQVAQAKAAGVAYLKCSAFRGGNTWVGYKVWPKLGYDGDIPMTETSGGEGLEPEVVKDLHEKFDEKFKAAGFKEPYQVSHLYRVEGGQEWWEENGDSFDAKFDLSDGSFSMKVLSAYLEEKAKQAKVSTKEWLSKTAKAKEQHEELDLDEADHKALDAVWSKLRK